MCGDAATVRYDLPAGACRLCGCALDPDDQQVCKAYHDDPLPLDSDALGVCPACHDDLAELVDTWSTIPEPPVDADSIAAGYERVADDCSFCERSLDEGVVGLEYYRAGTAHDDGLADLRHFALCPHCVSVFAEFLDTAAE